MLALHPLISWELFVGTEREPRSNKFLIDSRVDVSLPER